MAKVSLLGYTLRQYQGLPPTIQKALDWVRDELARSPLTLPEDLGQGISTIDLGGPTPLFRVSIRPNPRDPGYRTVYAVLGEKVYFIRIVRRDVDTYRNLRRALRLLEGRSR